MEDILPSDKNLEERRDLWETVFKNYNAIDNEEEISLDEISNIVEKDKNDDLDLDKENILDESLETSEYEENDKSDVSKDNVCKQLQVAVKEREKQWNEKGLAFTFDKVDEWLKSSEFLKTKHSLDPTGTKHFETNQGKKMERKRTYKNITCRTDSSNESDTSDNFSSSPSDTSVPSSVDTAQYILANQKRKTSKITKTIIKKYIVTSEKVSGCRDFKKAQPKPAIRDSIKQHPKQKRRKKRHELDKLHQSRTTNNQTESDSESEPVIRKKLAFVPRFMSTSNERLISSTRMQPKVRLNKVDIQVTPAKINVQASSTMNANNTSSLIVNDSIDSTQNSNISSLGTSVLKILKDSRKSWQNLPKKVIIYKPNVKSLLEKKVTITNEHFENALGVEEAREFMQNYNYDKEIDSNSMLILERPTTEEEFSCSSETDVLDYFKASRPRISIVPSDM